MVAKFMVSTLIRARSVARGEGGGGGGGVIGGEEHVPSVQRRLQTLQADREGRAS
jgi:hypothetical protein